ncbi:hypothetical protein BASA81_001476 [Batrachochytrium salamandrivorans]|nr:hypothetical protein BASA81_001476 [Batrachochytrium salamandrivorans]
MSGTNLSYMEWDEDEDLLELKRSFENLASFGKELFSSSYVPENPPQATASGMTPSSTGQMSKGAWTQEQDDALRAAVEKHGAKQWKSIAQEIPGGRTHIQCLQRWSKVLKPGLVKGAWTEEEDALLSYHVREMVKGNWVGVAEHVIGRTPKQCRERWMLVLDPTIKKDGWTQEEDEQLMRLHQAHGNAWALIAKQLQGRTENSTKSRFKSLERKRERSWTPQEDETIARARAEGRNWEAIAALLPNRTKHATKMRWKEFSNGGTGGGSSTSESPSPTMGVGQSPVLLRTLPPPPPPQSARVLAARHSSNTPSLPSWNGKYASSELLNSESFDRWLKEPRFDLPTALANGSTEGGSTLRHHPMSDLSLYDDLDDFDRV